MIENCFSSVENTYKKQLPQNYGQTKYLSMLIKYTKISHVYQIWPSGLGFEWDRRVSMWRRNNFFCGGGGLP